MNIHEDSMPLRFTPDGLDEATIDALIGTAYAQVNDVPLDVAAAVIPERRPVRRRAGKRSANRNAA